MPVFRVRVGAVTTWSSNGRASAILLVRAADSPGQRLVDEHLAVEGARVEEGPVLALGARPVRLHAEDPMIAIRYGAGVEVDDPRRIPVIDDRPLPAAGELPFGLLAWTLPSRYCTSDALGPTAEALFGEHPRDRALIAAVADWVREHIAYLPGSSDSLTTADTTLLARAGVCRDMSHLAAGLLRALDIPARVVAAYAPMLEPPDFHAVLEAHDGEAWRMIDVTGLVPVEPLVRIATGRDAADIAWASASGPMMLNDLVVTAALDPV